MPFWSFVATRMWEPRYSTKFNMAVSISGSGKFNVPKLIDYGNVWFASRVQSGQNARFRLLNKSISKNHFQGKVACATSRRGRGRMTFSRSEMYVFLEPAKDEQFVTQAELKEKIKEWLERWPNDLEMPMDLTKFNNNLDDVVDHLVKFACELELGGGTGSLQWYEVDLE